MLYRYASSSVLALSGCLFLASACVAQQSQPPKVSVTHKDVSYADQHAAQKLDVYLAKSTQPTPAMIYIHGGGWRGGSKNGVPAWLMKSVSEGWLSVISVEYRFTDVAKHPAQVKDCCRAIQFVRAHAKEWNIDPERIGVTGGSAGGHLSLWVALHDDIADTNATDAVAKQSSRVACAVSFAGPTDWSLLESLEHKHPAYRQLLGYEPGTPASAMNQQAQADVSPITFVSKEDPPVMQVHGDKDDIVPLAHAENLAKRLQQAGVTSELVVIPGGNHSVAGAGSPVTTQAEQFVQRWLKPQ